MKPLGNSVCMDNFSLSGTISNRDAYGSNLVISIFGPESFISWYNVPASGTYVGFPHTFLGLYVIQSE